MAENRLLIDDLTQLVCELHLLDEQSRRLVDAYAKEFVADHPEKISVH
jgi:hypothetical protein